MSCDRCEYGWVKVGENYAVAQFPVGDLSELPLDLAEPIAKDNAIRRAAAADSWYPCKVCQPSLFFRWAEGHLASNHDLSECAECAELRRGKRPGALTLAAPTPPETPEVPTRKDLDL